MTTITLDPPPSANRYWRVGHGRIYRSEAADAYKQHVFITCRMAGMEPLEGDVAIRLCFYRKSKRMDTDNMLKITLDALQGHAYHNDSQVAHITAWRDDSQPYCPRIEVTITAIGAIAP